jgi:Protein of unknown function (DUF3325)
MVDTLLRVLSPLLGVLGMAWLALAMNAHWQQLHADEQLTPAIAKRLRTLGASAIAASLVACLVVDHVSMAALVWIMQLTASALLVTFTLAWRPRWLSPLAR